MKDLLEPIRAALESDATLEARDNGAAACRKVLAMIDPPKPSVAPSLDVPALANVVRALRGVPADQVLDLAIAKLRSALPTGTELPTVKRKFRIIALPGART